jgi:putative ATPase
MKDLGHGRATAMPTTRPAVCRRRALLPEGLPDRFYEPVPRGLEMRIGEKLAELRRLNARRRRRLNPPGPL